MVKNTKKLRRKVLLPIVAGMAIAPCALGLVACAHAITEEDLIDQGFTNLVVYDYQGGKVSDAATTTIRVKDDSFLPQPGADKSGLASPARSGYSFRDFCVAKFDDDGNAIPDETKPWNFATDKSTEDNMTLCARWWKNYQIVLHYGDDYAQTTTIDVSRNLDGTPIPVASTQLKVNNYTFLEEYYTDASESTAINTSAIDQSLYEANENGVLDIYGKSLSGNYQIINSATALANMTIGSRTNLYINAELDMKDIQKPFAFPSDYSGTIRGNGHTISNLVLTQSPSNQTDNYYGIFKSLYGEVSDITFKNVTLNVNLSNPMVQAYNVGVLAGRAASGSKINNVTVDGCTLNITTVSGYDKEITISEKIANEISGSSVEKLTVGNISINLNGEPYDPSEE